jgi:hypothetical protein
VPKDVLDDLDDIIQKNIHIILPIPHTNILVPGFWPWDFEFGNLEPEYVKRAYLTAAFEHAESSGCNVYEYIYILKPGLQRQFLIIATNDGLRDRISIYLIMNS